MYFLFSRYVVFICTIELAHFDSDETHYEPPTPVDIVPEQTLVNSLKGGTPTDIRRYPFLVSIQKFSIPRCVGSLITDSWVLTAAHCLIDLNRKTIFMLDPVDFIIISGRTIMTSGTMEGQERQAGIFIIHSRFERNSFKYDVGMVETTKPFVLGPSTKTIRMYAMPPEVITFFQSCTLVGWNTGRHSFDDYEVPYLKPNSMKLEKIEMKVGIFGIRMYLPG
ncbi:serine protease 55-like isoform X2 [Harmonia axyridis]|uniref:serine protease 55-like isoform X2 n=1 Tax=Harmonia axyridis TaxID=115357 RepID=UPI001E27675D|nr:serine protease 55-like isoform X2 [Harmonia axyridis]